MLEVSSFGEALVNKNVSEKCIIDLLVKSIGNKNI